MIKDSRSNSESTIVVMVDEIPEELDLEILGRKRPDVFSSTLTEAIFVGSMLMCLSMAVRIYPKPARLVLGPSLMVFRRISSSVGSR